MDRTTYCQYEYLSNQTTEDGLVELAESMNKMADEGWEFISQVHSYDLPSKTNTLVVLMGLPDEEDDEPEEDEPSMPELVAVAGAQPRQVWPPIPETQGHPVYPGRWGG